MSSQDGDLDTTFADNGIFQLLNKTFDPSLIDLSVDNSNNIIISGTVINSDNTESVNLIKLLPDGELDLNFGNNGYAMIHYNPWWSVSKSIFLENGKIVLVGTINSNSGDIIVVKLNSDGTLDTSFGTNGRFILDFDSRPDRGFTIAENNGSLIVGGYVTNNLGNKDFALVKILTNGVLDTSFGDNGLASFNFDIANEEIRDLLVTESGEIYACGSNEDDNSSNNGGYGGNYDFSILKLNQNGDLVNDFGDNGRLIFSAGNKEKAYSIKQVSNSFMVIGTTDDVSFDRFGAHIIKINSYRIC